MASLKDAVQLTTQLNDLTQQLHAELTEGDVDFERMVELADEISEHSDVLAGAFTRVNEALQEPLAENGAGGESRSRGSSRRETAGADSKDDDGSS